MNFNKVLIAGNLTRDPQLKFLPSQMAIAEFGIACNRKFKTAQGEQREEVTFIDCAAWGKTGELINQYFTKGKPIFLEGRLKYDSWDDKQGGGKRSKLTIVVENFQFCGGDRQGDQQQEQPRTQSSFKPAKQPVENPIGGDKEFEDGDIPF